MNTTEANVVEADMNRMKAAIADIRPHVDAWISLLTAYVNSLPPDTQPTPECEGHTGRSYAEHELRAMKRDLAALLVSDLRS